MLVVGRGLSARRKAPRCAREMNRGMSCADGGSEHTHPLWLGASCGERVESIDIDLWW